MVILMKKVVALAVAPPSSHKTTAVIEALRWELMKSAVFGRGRTLAACFTFTFFANGKEKEAVFHVYRLTFHNQKVEIRNQKGRNTEK